MIARALMALPPVRAAVCWLAGDRPPPKPWPEEETLDQRIGRAADELRRQGYAAITALAAAEAVEIGREHGLDYERIEFDIDRLTWYGIYETRHRAAHPTAQVKVPLQRATESTQRGVGSLN